MANTTFNTRIQLKYDLYSVWTTQNPVLLKGELAIAEIPSETGVVQNEPAYLLKVGDGVKKFNELEWISGKAADVYAWAKAATKPTYQASEIQGLDTYITGKVQDTNTKYQIVKNGDLGFKLQFKELNGEWTDQDDITLVAPTYSLLEGETNGTVKFGITGSEAEVKVHGLGSAAYTESSAYDAAGTGANEAGKVKTALIGTEGDKSSSDTIKGAKKYADEKASAAESHADGLIAGLTSEGQTAGTGEVISKITQANGVITVEKKTLTEADIPSIPTSKVTNLDTTLAGKQDTLVFNTPYNASSNKAATMADVQSSIEGLSGAMHYIGESTTNPAEGTVTIEAKPEYSPAAGDVVTYQKKEFVYDGEAWRELGDESSFAVKGSIKDADIASDANIAQSKIAGLEAALAGKATPADITSAIEDLDVAITNVSTGKKITSIEEVDGKIQVSTGAIVAGDIPELPTSKITGLDTTLGNKADSSTVTALGERLTTAEDEIDTLQEQIATKADETEVTAVNTRIDNLDNNDAEVDGQFVVSAVQTDGLVAVARKKVNIAKLEQSAGEYIIFNCGSATVNI